MITLPVEFDFAVFFGDMMTFLSWLIPLVSALAAYGVITKVLKKA